MTYISPERRLGTLLSVSLIALFVAFASVRVVQILHPPELSVGEPNLGPAAQAAAKYAKSGSGAVGFVDGVTLPGLSLSMNSSRTLKLPNQSYIDVVGWDMLKLPPHPKLADLTFAIVDGSSTVPGKPSARPDVATVYKDASVTNAGFTIRIGPSLLTSGAHTIVVFAADTGAKRKSQINQPLTVIVP